MSIFSVIPESLLKKPLVTVILIDSFFWVPALALSFLYREPLVRWIKHRVLPMPNNERRKNGKKRETFNKRESKIEQQVLRLENARDLFTSQLKEAVVPFIYSRALLWTLSYFLTDFNFTFYHPSYQHITWIINDVFWILACNDLALYVHHRLMHTKFMYSRFHHVHHRYRRPQAINAETNHVIEEFTLIAFNATATLISRPSSIYSIWIAYALMQFHAVENHLGIDLGLQYISDSFFGGLFSFAPKHDAHHLRVVGNYGSFTTLWDRIFGTTI